MWHKTLTPTALLGALALLAACSSDDGGGTAPTATTTPLAATATRTATGAPPTATRTSPPAATPTATLASTIPATATVTPPATATVTPPSGAAFSALVVVRGDFRANLDDALGDPPAQWSSQPGTSNFDRALSHATWRIDGPVQLQGDTNADGSFGVAGLPPGSYRLDLSKTAEGNLLGVEGSFTVGNGGQTTLVVEIAQGLVRWTNTYADGGTTVREVAAPNGSHLVTRDGKIAALSASGRAYVDADGDGSFDPSNCGGNPPLWLCGADKECGDQRACSCIASCPGCEDCRLGVCSPDPSLRFYTCSADKPCANSGERCACVSSCPKCDDCAASVCVPATCVPATITGITADGPNRLFVGQHGSMSAVAHLSDGWTIDVTQLVDWASSNADVADVDVWGGVTAVAVGSADISAALAGQQSAPWSLEVAARPPLVRLYLQNRTCAYPIAQPDIGPNGAAPRPLPPGAIYPPDCRQILRIGGTIQFFVLGEFEDGYYEDVTALVAWELNPAGVGQVAAGLFTGAAVGTTQLRARLGDVTSEATTIKVVDQATIVALQIYPLAAVPIAGPLPPQTPSDAAIPCYDCGYTVTILRGDDLPFQATAAYDTGEWEDVTKRVTWTSTNPALPVSTGGVLSAAVAGETVVSATLADVVGNSVKVRAVETAALQSLSIYQEGIDRVVEKGEQRFFHALGYYDVGFSREITDKAVWKSSDESIGGFEKAGVFIGRSAGNVEVWAELDGVQSNRLPFEVFQTSSLAYCDDNNINRAEWEDAFNRVVLDSDCGLYTHPALATLRFTVTERARPGGVFDPCLDLYVSQGSRLVRTIREEGCGQPFLAPGAPEFDKAAVRYQTLAFWDLKDDRGSPVPPGKYTIQGRFYLYYDPVISLDLVISAPNGRIPCQQNACGNGCGYVHVCGDGGGPLTCPTVCTDICECPAGWGKTEAGDCEPCAEECCPSGAACLPGTPNCEPPPVCCPDGQTCIPELPPCTPRCCPLGALCGPLDLPPCNCCPTGDQCETGLGPCEPQPPCCPKGALCILPLPTCEDDCCPPGAQCADNLVPCSDLMCCHPDGSCLPDQPPCRNGAPQ